MRRTRASAFAGAALCLVGLGASACGSGGSPSAAPWRLVAAAPQKTTDAETAQFALTVVTNVLGQSVTLTGSGAFDFSAHDGALTLALPAAIGGETIKEIVTPSTLYLQIPRLTPAGKYAAIKIPALTGNSTLEQLGNADPTPALETLRGASHDVRKVGTATIRGTSTTHYSGTIDIAAAVKETPVFVRERVQRIFGQVKSFPFDAYIDGQGRLRRFVEHITLPASSSTGNQAVTVASTFDLFDFGTVVKATPPPASQTVNGSSLLNLLSRRS